MNSYERHRNMPPDQYEDELKKELYKRTGEIMDFNCPASYNAKIQWLKLYDNTPEKTRLADKLLVREYVSKRIGEEYLIPLLGSWNRFDEINFDSLPNSFVLKTNHSYKTNIIVKDKALLDVEAAEHNFNYWLKDNFACHDLELQYADIPPKIIAEEYLSNNDNDLYDYKVLCFNGKAQNILYIQNRYSSEQLAYFDLDWNKLEITNDNIPIVDTPVPRPKKLDLLVSLAEKLAQGFALVRVDFYVLNDDSIRFGEMTFTPADGMNNWQPEEINTIWGKQLVLPESATPLPDRSFAEKGVEERTSFSRRNTDYISELVAERKNNKRLVEENMRLKKAVSNLTVKKHKRQSLKSRIKRKIILGYYGLLRLFAHKEWQKAYIRYMEEFRFSKKYDDLHEKMVSNLTVNRPDIMSSPIRRKLVMMQIAIDCTLFGEEPDNFWGCDYAHTSLSNKLAKVSGNKLNFGINIINDPGEISVLRNKAEFARHFSDFFNREWCTPHDISEREFCRKFERIDKLIIKPLNGSRGRGISVINNTDNLQQLYYQLQTEKPSIVEEYITQTGLLHDLNPSSLNTIRVITIRLDNRIIPASCYLRLGGLNSFTDNQHAGGVLVSMRMSDGMLLDGMTMSRNHLRSHPQTGITYYGHKIPRWSEVLDFCIRAHKKAPAGLNLIGWDVCVDETHLLMIEGNEIPGFGPYRRGNPKSWKLLKEFFNAAEKRGAFDSYRFTNKELKK